MRPGVPPARTFVTGIGVMTPIGCTLEEYWNALLEGESGIAPLPGGPGLAVRVAGQISEPVSYAVPSRVAVQTDRWTHLAMTAAVAALADAGIRLEEHSAYDLSVHTASSSGGNEFGQREIQALWAEGPDLVGPYQSIAWFYAATTGQLSIRHGMKGWSGVLVAEQAGGLDAFAQARRALRQGSRAVLTGATEAPLSPYALTCQLASGQVSTRDDPRRAYRPFRSDASGFVPGEGGAVLVVEP
ncbi:MAG TPA: beta-ketoacyl synthase N-terminal-like domain-containing protein, partial [Streptomyces sp.]